MENFDDLQRCRLTPYRWWRAREPQPRCDSVTRTLNIGSILRRLQRRDELLRSTFRQEKERTWQEKQRGFSQGENFLDSCGSHVTKCWFKITRNITKYLKILYFSEVLTSRDEFSSNFHRIFWHEKGLEQVTSSTGGGWHMDYGCVQWRHRGRVRR